MSSPLHRHLLLEQRAFLGRDRGAWGEHLARARAWLGTGLEAADRDRPCLILGAGWGLEVPWRKAPQGTWGWDADPLSRFGTWLRHRRWAPWVGSDLTGALGGLAGAAHRCARDRWGRRREPGEGARRLAGLLPSFRPGAAPLRAWCDLHGPATILAANVVGQLGPVAQALIRRAFAPADPFDLEGPASEALVEALEAWTAEAVRGVYGVLAQSGAHLTLLHDRGVVWGAEAPGLQGPWRDPWTEQLPPGHWEVSDALGEVEVGKLFAGSHEVRARDRWWWPVVPGQLHLVEGWELVPTGNPGGPPGP